MIKVIGLNIKVLKKQEVRAEAPVVAIIVANAALPIILRAVRRVKTFSSIIQCV